MHTEYDPQASNAMLVDATWRHHPDTPIPLICRCIMARAAAFIGRLIKVASALLPVLNALRGYFSLRLACNPRASAAPSSRSHEDLTAF